VPGGSGKISTCGPTPVAVHDAGDMHASRVAEARVLAEEPRSDESQW
jgi:hypothetical protein